MMVILFVAVWSFVVGVGLSYLLLAGIVQIERQREIYPALSSSIPVLVCHPDRHNALTGAYQEDEDAEGLSLSEQRIADYHEQMAMDERLMDELSAEIDELERDAHEYRMEIRRLRDELAEVRSQVAPAAPVATVSRYNVVDKFEWIEVSE
ncbi:MAG: hypothetical protein AB7L09_24770 [Nitrospira sp.]